jgi:hypothetical protein
MSELQLALIGLAFALLAALLVYNKWQERRALRQLRDSLNAGVSDALLDTEPAPPPRMAAVAPRLQEPTLRTINAPAPPPGHRVEPRLGPLPPPPVVAAGAGGDGTAAADALAAPLSAAQASGDLEQPTEAAATGGWIEDPLLDCVLELRCTHAVDGVAVFDAAAPRPVLRGLDVEHMGSVRSLCWSACTNMLLSLGSDGSAVVWCGSHT